MGLVKVVFKSGMNAEIRSGQEKSGFQKARQVLKQQSNYKKKITFNVKSTNRKNTKQINRKRDRICEFIQKQVIKGKLV